jgi:hypothetical protein
MNGVEGSGFKTWTKVNNVTFEPSSQGIRVAAAYVDGFLGDGWVEILQVTLVNDGTASFDHPFRVNLWNEYDDEYPESTLSCMDSTKCGLQPGASVVFWTEQVPIQGSYLALECDTCDESKIPLANAGAVNGQLPLQILVEP